MAESSSQNATQVLTQLQALWQRQPAGRRSLAILVLLGIAGVVLWTTVIRQPAAWTPVSQGASPDDAQELMTTLQARGVTARLREGKVEVADADLDRARAVAAAAGLPRTGKGFELFDKSSLGQSSFAEQINYRRALQGELARSIATLAQVEGARVHIALGKRSVFKDRDEPASASVAVRLHGGQVLSAEQVRGIRQLVAASVDGMKAEQVVVVDNHGNLLDSSEPGARDRKAEIERTITQRVRSMLERVVGVGKVSVVATADVDDRQINETQELFDPATPVVRSESRTVEGTDAAGMASGIAGTRGNLPGAPAPTTPPAPGALPTVAPAGGAAAGPGRVQETKNYEISRTVRQTVSPEMQIKKLHLAVIVDFKADAAGKPLARTDAELTELKALARQAAGVDDARGDQLEVRSMSFAPDPEVTADLAPTAKAGLPIVPIAAGAGGAVVLLALFMLLTRRGRKPRDRGPQIALPVGVAELERALARRPLEIAAGEPDPAQPALPAGRSVRDRVLETVRGDVERTAGILSSWLATSPATPPAAHTAKEAKS